MGQTTVRPRATQQVEQPQTWNFDLQPQQGKILAFSGKIAAGKSTCTKYLHSLALMFVVGLTRESFVDDSGNLIVLDSDNNYQEFNLDDKSPETTQFLQMHVWPFMKKYACADNLKQICVNVLGLDEKLVYGSQEDKNTLTHLKWENMPTRVHDKVNPDDVKSEDDIITEEVPQKFNSKKRSAVKTIQRTGYMSVRDVLEYVGSELFRQIDGDCWANSLVRSIQKENPSYAIVEDVRFPNEVAAIKRAGGKVIRLTRTNEDGKQNTHISNTALDDFDEFDAIIDNSSMGMDEMFRELLAILTGWGWFKVVN